MPCDQPIIPTLPLLGCCGAAPFAYREVVAVAAYRGTLVPGPPSLTDLDTVYQRCVSLPYNPQVPGDEHNSSRSPLLVLAIPGAPAGGDWTDNTLETWCYPDFFDANRGWAGWTGPEQSLLFHGWALNMPAFRFEYYAVKMRWNFPTARRICKTQCDHFILSSNCDNKECDSGIGNPTTTLMPAQGAQIEMIAPRMTAFTGRVGETRDFTSLRVLFDTDPPSSPFCGLP